MITVQINLYILTYNTLDRDFDVISLSKEKLKVPSKIIESSETTIKEQLDSLFKTVTIDYSPIAYRLLNNIILDSTYHSVYFCMIPSNIEIKDTVHNISVNKYAIHSPNIQQILQKIR